MEHVHGWYVEYLVGGFIQDGSPILPILSNLTASSVETHLSGPHPMSPEIVVEWHHQLSSTASY